MERILCTGGAGFLGHNIVNRMADDGHMVAVLDNCHANVARLRWVHGRIVYHCGTVTSPNNVIAAFENTLAGAVALDVVWHLAAMNGATRDFYDHPADVLDVQIRGTQHVIDMCIAHGVKTLILFSSSEVYQTAPIYPTPENVPRTIPDIRNPRYSYAIGKIAAEAMAWHSKIEKVVVVLPHNVYGPNAGYGHVIPEMILRAARTPDRGAFAINGSATRSFIYIDDFVDAMMAIWKRTEATEGKVREIYHVGTEDQTSTTALAGQVCRLMGRGTEDGRYPFAFKVHAAPEGSPRVRCPDTTKVRALGWSPKVSLDEGLRKTIDAYMAKQGEWPQ